MRKTCGVTVAPGSHASNGVAEVTVKLLRQQANFLRQQAEGDPLCLPEITWGLARQQRA